MQPVPKKNANRVVFDWLAKIHVLRCVFRKKTNAIPKNMIGKLVGQKKIHKKQGCFWSKQKQKKFTKGKIHARAMIFALDSAMSTMMIARPV